MLRQWHRHLLAVSLTGLLTTIIAAGCATVPEGSDHWRESQRSVLKMRAEARWSGLIEGDFAKAYSYLSPDYRSVVSLQQYQRKYGRVVDWRLARVNDIGYDSPTVASVLVEVTYRVAGLRGSNEVVENNKLITEKWLYKDGGWWYTDQ